MKRFAKYLLLPLLMILVILEIGVRIIVDLPAETGFYGSIKREDIRKLQKQ